jgi:aryl-alcohol dehydrogenase-like predicted oxidoreductase
MGISSMQFGRTGHRSTRVIFGGAALGAVSQSEADRSLEILLEYGINHLDVAASYGEGEAEKRMGPWMAGHRTGFFLATKTGKRSYQEALDDLRGSLERLRVDSVDLVQIHNLTDPDEWEQVFSSSGALEAMIEAREQGLTRFIGVTGHGYTVAEMHLKSLERFDFDSVLLPYNYIMMQNEAYARSFQTLKQRCIEKKVALQTIKSLARRPWQGQRVYSTWYQPLEEGDAIQSAVHWVLGDPEAFLISPADINLLPRVLEAASRAESRPPDQEMEQMRVSQQMQPVFRGNDFIW